MVYKYADLEQRTEKFATDIRKFLSKIPRSFLNEDDVRQLIRSSGSVAANYIEANESLGRKDFVMKIRTCRKESKESALWLRLLQVPSQLDLQRNKFEQEAREFVLIFAAILRKCL